MTTNQTIDGVPSECRECGSAALSWFAQNTVPNGIQQNRLNTSDVQCVFVLGCDDCSETLKIISADKIAEHFNKPAAQPQGKPVAKLSWEQIVGLVNEVLGCEAHEWPLPDVGHVMTGINFNSLARIIDRVQAEQPAPVAVVQFAGFSVVEDPPIPPGQIRMCDCNQGRLPCRCKP